MESAAQTVPVRMYRAPEKLVLVAPMPGLEPQDISVKIANQSVSLMGKERGPRQHERDLVIDEWCIGPYFREVSLEQAVDGSLANATYGNGVLVVSLPTAHQGRTATDASFELTPIEATRGEHVGHVGTDIRPAETSGRGKERAGD